MHISAGYKGGIINGNEYYEKQSSKNEALEILNGKFANGEIPEEECFRKRNILKDDNLN
ncbi:hypothetical protein [Petrotoga sp. 9PWA.NaAc.5.4]|uniref:hypothetical protein n=1 Tax=Petrotoga sp. 9PWA.NaAc.5.4 TaxID=1434328 RepID=UPI000CAF01CA|nr:hypothetical protein [Petrotoga sp. 9PWA.NaAc.5.4]PNR92411.1 membrane protein [Petrotoga sp. 9PWA.NaAc.5.4]